MATIQFDPATFRATFPAFADVTKYPDASLSMYWDMGTNYVTNQQQVAGPLNLSQQTLALNLMTAHVAQLYTQINAGQATGIVQASTVDKVSVTLVPPESPNAFRYWLNQSIYGQQLLALLNTAAIGGFYYNGFPVSTAFRR